MFPVQNTPQGFWTDLLIIKISDLVNIWFGGSGMTICLRKPWSSSSPSLWETVRAAIFICFISLLSVIADPVPQQLLDTLKTLYDNPRLIKIYFLDKGISVTLIRCPRFCWLNCRTLYKWRRFPRQWYCSLKQGCHYPYQNIRCLGCCIGSSISECWYTIQIW